MLPVIQALSGEVRVSVDTAKASVADAALGAGATVLNDITGTLWPVAARRGAAWVAMHMQGRPADMQREPRYEDVVSEVFGFVLDRARAAAAAGVDEIWVDPGIGFGKTVQHNLALLAHLDALCTAARAEGFGTLDRDEPQELLGHARWFPGSAARSGRSVGGFARHRCVVGDPRSGHGPRPRRRGDSPGGDAERDDGRRGGGVKGKWAAGIPPRNFTWVIRDRLAVSERPGGFSPNHRRVRRQEEIIWFRVQGFTRVVSLLPSPHNLAAYDDEGLAWSHYPLQAGTDPRPMLADCYRELDESVAAGARVLVHQDGLGDWVMGAVAGFLLWSGRLPSPPQSITLVEHLVGHQMGPVGRELVVAVEGLPPRAATG